MKIILCNIWSRPARRRTPARIPATGRPPWPSPTFWSVPCPSPFCTQRTWSSPAIPISSAARSTGPPSPWHASPASPSRAAPPPPRGSSPGGCPRSCGPRGRGLDRRDPCPARGRDGLGRAHARDPLIPW